MMPPINTTTWVISNATSGWCWCMRCVVKAKCPEPFSLFQFMEFAEEFAVIHKECEECPKPNPAP